MRSDKSRPDPRLYIILRNGGYLGVTVHTLLVPVFFFLDIPSLGYLNMLSVLMWVAGMAANNRNHYALAIALHALEIVIHSIAVVLVLGWEYGFQLYLFGLIPYVLFCQSTRREIIVALIIGIASSYVALSFWQFYFSGSSSESIISAIIYAANASVVFAAIAIACFYFYKSTLLAEDKLIQLASTDPLTGLLNRRRMNEVLNDTKDESDRYETPFCLMICDIDHFKSINDKYGHDFGDIAIKHVVDIITRRLRKTDHMARWGGEEFLVLYPQTTLDDAVCVTESLRQAIDAKPVEYNDASSKITLTFGIADKIVGESLQNMIKRADQALYIGKEQGRNCVRVAEK